MYQKAPSIFISHGLPPMALMDDPYNSALINFGRNIEVRGIICVSSHWISPGPLQITSNPKPFIQYNFHGFQKELYDLNYSTPFSEELIQEVQECLSENSFETALSTNYGLDHGIWMPLRLIRPEGDLPVVQISLPLYHEPREIMKLGHSLSSLREKGFMLMGSGEAAFNPAKIVWHARGENVNPKIKEFNEWLLKSLEEAKIEEILDYRKSAPHGEFAHPSSASLLPLFFTMGSSLAGDKPRILFNGYKYSTTSLLSFCLWDRDIASKSFS